VASPRGRALIADCHAWLNWFAAVVIVLGLAGMTAPALADALSSEDRQCLNCHAAPGLEMPVGGGATLSLHVAEDRFAPSVHSVLGCTGCHEDIKLPGHPATGKPIAGKREFSIAMVQVCRTCHDDKFEQWQTSVHAALVNNGDTAAPICTGCHAPHAIIKGTAAAMDTVPCKACHGDIFTAYAASVHGILRSGGVTQAPLCFSCHGAHDVRVPSAGVGRRDVCLGCHTEAVDSHRKWLPNVDLHFTAVVCSVCHTPRKQRVVNLILYNRATRQELFRPEGIPRFEALKTTSSAARSGLDATTLMTLLSTLNRQGIEGETSIRGRLEVGTGIEDHQLIVASKAIGDCDTCHQRGAAAFQSVVVSVAGPAGIPIRYDANKEVLNSALSIDSIGGFYAIGGTRITFLDVLFALALLCGAGGPLAHLFARWAVPRFLIGHFNEQRER
jgi:hypothetical protein